jgi:hypothetical protein
MPSHIYQSYHHHYNDQLRIVSHRVDQNKYFQIQGAGWCIQYTLLHCYLTLAVVLVLVDHLLLGEEMEKREVMIQEEEMEKIQILLVVKIQQEENHLVVQEQ